MNARGNHDVPLLHGTFTIRSPRSVLLLNPFQLPLVVGLLLVAVVFTIWPQALDHSPVSFEKRGLVHHVWHYTLLLGSALTLVGMLAAARWRLKAEFVGLVSLIVVAALNMIALTSAEGPTSGFDLALRAAVIVGLSVRAVIVVTEPTVDVSAERRR